MPSVVHTIDVNSPLVKYAGPNNQGTFVFCAGTQCSASLAFTGTEVHVVGAYRLNSCPFQVVLDGEVFGPFGTEPVVVEQFQIDLFNKTDLVAGPHSLTISNLPALVSNKPNMDLDYFTWTSEVNSLTDVRIQDDNQAFVYAPPSAWKAFNASFTGLPGFDQGTGHVTLAGGATATFSFVGDRVALYGAIGTQGGPYSVHVDSGSASTFTAQQMIADPNTGMANYLADQLLFYADSLAPGKHTVTFTSDLITSNQDLTIDYAIVDGTLNSADGSAPPSTTTQRLSSAQLGGIIAGAILLALGFLAVLFYALKLRRQLRKGVSNEGTTPSTLQPSFGSIASERTTSLAQSSFAQQSISDPAFRVTPFLPAARPPEKRWRGRQLDPPGYESVETTRGQHAGAV
ncbi:hypothetical protein MVEN_01959700 [Mycena venus]|uniref:Uncharacterized protein n=1 Tax=Mycena venus TaxID=2733690 RepID=A0A8H6XH38_9AGAR|nr:hypothetical protein MVEN_01959700 [Mycena venus]